nr:MAG: GNAT family N-acetyltransferase [Bacillota bacterium]
MDEIRPLRREELEAAFSLSEFAFQYTLSPEDRARGLQTARPERILGCFVDGRLAAKATVLPMRVYVHGELVPAGGVAGVATWPEYRRQGLVRQLLAEALRRMREAGQTLSLLHPFSVPFYRQFGWEVASEYKTYTLERPHYPAVPPSPGRMECADGDWQRLDAIYRAYARQYTLMLERDEEWWRERVFPRKCGRAAVYRDAAGRDQGYVLYRVRDRVLSCQEMVWLTEEARRGLWRFLMNHDSMADRMELRVTADDDQYLELPEPRVRQQVSPEVMARIVDLEGFLRQCRFAADTGESRLLLEVTDDFAPWNAGWYEIAWAPDGTASVRRAEEAVGTGDGPRLPSARCSIGDLTAMLLGYRRPRALHRTGRLEADEEAVRLLERRIPAGTTGIMDFF